MPCFVDFDLLKTRLQGELGYLVPEENPASPLVNHTEPYLSWPVFTMQKSQGKGKHPLCFSLGHTALFCSSLEPYVDFVSS